MSQAPVPMSLRVRPWLGALVWVPSLYLAMGVPFNVVQSTAARMYQSLGVGEEKIALALGWLALAWSAKPLWAWLLERFGRKHLVIVGAQLFMATLLLGIGALATLLPTSTFFSVSLVLVGLIAFASATQDICGDGLYLASLDPKNQARLSGLQSTFWVSGKVIASGLLITVATGLATQRHWATNTTWAMVMGAAGLLMALLGVYHSFSLPKGRLSPRPPATTSAWVDLRNTAETFLQKREFWGMLAFILFYRVGEGLLFMSGPLFLQAPQASGGLGLSPGDVAIIDSTYGTVAVLVGGLAGGAVCARLGLRRCIGFFALLLNIPHLSYAILGELAASAAAPSHALVTGLVSIEKFGYGFGFVANMVYLMQQVAPGRSMMTHFAYATSLMNLILVPTAMLSGSLCNWLGYRTFFWCVLPVSLISIWVARRAPFPIDASECEPLTNSTGASDDLVTIDDDTRLKSRERDLKRLTGQASGSAMLHVLLVLVGDTTVLGALRGNAALMPGAWWGAILAVLFAVKVNIGLRTRVALRNVRASSAPPVSDDSVASHAYRRNAQNAWSATKVCLALDVALFATGMALLA